MQENTQESVANVAMSPLSLTERVGQDLQLLLSKFKDQKKGLRILADKTGIHEKTFQRLLHGKHRPSYMTLFKLYRYIFAESDDLKILQLVDPVVRAYLIKANPQSLVSNVQYTKNVDQDLLANPVMGEIYLLCSTGPISREEIVKRFGSYGLSLLKKMCEQNVLVESGQGQVELGTRRASFEPETILALSNHLLAHCFKLLDGDVLQENYLGMYVEGLSSEAYKKWIAIDQEAFRQKVELSKDKNNQGSIRAFTVAAVEKMNLEEIL